MTKNKIFIIFFLIILGFVAFVYFSKFQIKQNNALVFQLSVNNEKINYSIIFLEEKMGKKDLDFIIEVESEEDQIFSGIIEHTIPTLGTIKVTGRQSRAHRHVADWMTLQELEKNIRLSSIKINNKKYDLKSINIEKTYIDPVLVRSYKYGGSK